jgi:superfamily I DNA/RNA helicase
MPSSRASAAVDNTPTPAAVVLREFTPSELQLAIFEWFKRGPEAGNLIVRARAGTGKTTTILRAVDFAPERAILIAAFNKRIQEELAARLSNPNATALTLHSLGYRMLRKHVGYIATCKRSEREEAIADMVSKGLGYGAKRLVGRLVTKAREILPSLDNTLDQMVDLAEEFDITPSFNDTFTIEQLAGAALHGLRWAANPESAKFTGIDFADMIFLPLVNGMVSPDFDMVVVDEAQDMSASQLTLAMRACKPEGRVVLVGDDRQAIYGFRGADSGSLDRLKGVLDADELPLSKTYRCPQKVHAIAQRFVPDYEVDASAPAGVVSRIASLDDLVSRAKAGDFVLSRRNAPLARTALRFLMRGIPARIVGRDIGAALKQLVKQLAVGSAADSVPEFLARLQSYENKQRARLIAEKHEHRIDEMVDKCETLRILAEGARSVPSLVVEIDNLFVADPGAYVICSSVHKAKGLEATNVFLLESTFFLPAPCVNCKRRPSQCKCREFEVDEMKRKEEENIYYVAVTRAKETLTFIEEKF